MWELHWYRSWAEEPGYTTGNPPEDYGQIRGGCSFPWMIAVGWCFCTMPYSMQLTGQIPNDPPRMGAKSTTTIVLLLATIPVPHHQHEEIDVGTVDDCPAWFWNFIYSGWSNVRVLQHMPHFIAWDWTKIIVINTASFLVRVQGDQCIHILSTINTCLLGVFWKYQARIQPQSVNTLICSFGLPLDRGQTIKTLKTV